MKKVYLSVLWKRLCMETPSFFKRVSRIGLSIAGACIATQLYISANSVVIPWMEKILEYGIVIGAVSTFIAQFAVEKPEDLHKPNDCDPK